MNQSAPPSTSNDPGSNISHAFRRWTTDERGPHEKLVSNNAPSITNANTLTGIPNRYAQRDCSTESQSDPAPHPTTFPPLSETESRYAEMAIATSRQSRTTNAVPPRRTPSRGVE